MDVSRVQQPTPTGGAEATRLEAIASRLEAIIPLVARSCHRKKGVSNDLDAGVALPVLASSWGRATELHGLRGPVPS